MWDVTFVLAVPMSSSRPGRARGWARTTASLRPWLAMPVGGGSSLEVLADAGYDSEANHRLARRELGLESDRIGTAQPEAAVDALAKVDATKAGGIAEGM